MSTIQIGIQSDTVVKPSALAVGVAAFGGTVAYILQPGDPGFVVGQIKGFVCSPAIGSNGGTDFWAPSTTLTGATATAIGTGLANSDTIVAAFGTGSAYAARTCRSYNAGGFNDWYMPSRDELVKILQNNSILGLPGNPIIFSSSQINASTVWGVLTSNAGTQSIPFGGSYYYVIAIRNFIV
jgi:hypothetical protein